MAVLGVVLCEGQAVHVAFPRWFLKVVRAGWHPASVSAAPEPGGAQVGGDADRVGLLSLRVGTARMSPWRCRRIGWAGRMQGPPGGPAKPSRQVRH